MTLAKPAVVMPLTTSALPDAASQQPDSLVAVSSRLNTPLLMNADTTRRFVPIYFCGEAVPIDNSYVARQWLRTLMQCQSQREELYVIRKRAAVFFPVIDPILRRFDIPSDFRYIPLAESALVNDCVSPKGASGYWQMMPQTAREMGLIVNGDIDERYDLGKSTVAVCRLLRELHHELGSWALVAAAYNAGLNHVQNRMISQRENNYFNLRLYRETSQYLYRVLAYKELLTNPRQYKMLLSSDVISYLTRPLPAKLEALSGTKNSSVAAIGKDSELTDIENIDPAWGPRTGENFLGVPSLAHVLLAAASYASIDPITGETDLTSQQKGQPIPKLLGLMVLRFRRPRFLRQTPGTGRRPRHRWEWV